MSQCDHKYDPDYEYDYCPLCGTKLSGHDILIDRFMQVACEYRIASPDDKMKFLEDIRGHRFTWLTLFIKDIKRQ